MNTGNDISLAFCVVYVIRMRHNGQIMPGVFQHCYQNREAKITNSFCSGIIISYSMVLHIILADILLIARIFPSPELSARIICKTIEYDLCILLLFRIIVA